MNDNPHFALTQDSYDLIHEKIRNLEIQVEKLDKVIQVLINDLVSPKPRMIRDTADIKLYGKEIAEGESFTTDSKGRKWRVPEGSEWDESIENKGDM